VHFATVQEDASIPITVKITGIKLDPAAMGRSNVPGHGHYHFYIDCIPADAYTAADLEHCWAAAAGTTNAKLDLSTSHVKVAPGTHVLLVALAQNDHVLYPVPPAVLLLTVVRTQPSIRLISPMGAVTVKQNGKVHVRVRVAGIDLNMNAMGKRNVAGEGHYHFYLDCVPQDAYAVADLQHCWMAASASQDTYLDLSTSHVKVSVGTHLLIIALAQNDHVLYKAPAPDIVMTVTK
jgi:hypothetical protein